MLSMHQILCLSTEDIAIYKMAKIPTLKGLHSGDGGGIHNKQDSINAMMNISSHFMKPKIGMCLLVDGILESAAFLVFFLSFFL